MSLLQGVGSWLYQIILSDAAIFISLICFVAQLASKVPAFDSFISAIKCYIGYTVFITAIGKIVSTFRPVVEAVRETTGVQVVINESYYGQATMLSAFQELGGNIGYIGLVMALGYAGLLLMVIFKKYTKIRNLSIQSNGLVTASIFNLATVYCLYPTLADWHYVLMGALLFTVMKTVKSNFTIEPCQDISDGMGMCIDHSQCYLDAFWWYVGKKIEKKSIEKTGKRPKHFEDIEFPRWMNVFTDVYVMAFFVMFLYFGVMFLVIGKEELLARGLVAANSSFVVGAMKLALSFPAQLVILFTGLRMFVAEIMTGFDGLSRLMPGGVLPAIDVAAFYSYAGDNTVVTIGFLCGASTMLLSSTVLILSGSPIVVLVGFTQMMFDNGSVAIFGHARGGIKGAICGAISCGLVDVLLCISASYLTGFYAYGGISSASDYCIDWGILGWFWKIGPIGFYIYIAVKLMIPNIHYWLCKDKKAYWLVAEDYEAYKEYMAEKGTPVLPVNE